MIPRRAADVIVVGAGPAGMQAAVDAADSGASVVLLDAGSQPGGQYHRQLPDAFHPAAPEEVHHDQPAAAGLIDRIHRHRRISYRPRMAVWAAEPRTGTGATLHLAHSPSGEAAGALSAPVVILATGAHDRVLPFPGWELPGVMTAGAAQALVKGQRLVPGDRVLVAGTGPFLLPVAVSLLDAGVDVVGVLEANRPRGWMRQPRAVALAPEKVAEAARYAANLARHRVPVRNGRAVVAAHGDDRVTSVTTAKLRKDWSPVPGSEKRVEVDAVAVGYGFVPQLELALALGCDTVHSRDGSTVVAVDDRQRTSVTGVYAAGEVTGVGGAVLAAAEGALAGLAAAADLGVVGDRAYWARASAWEGARNRYRRFAHALAEVYPVPDGWHGWLTDDTIVCRCEEVPYQQLRKAIDDVGGTGLRTVKLVTRIGMGPCQARMCGWAATSLVAAAGDEPTDPLALGLRPIATPLRLGSLAEQAPAESPEPIRTARPSRPLDSDPEGPPSEPMRTARPSGPLDSDPEGPPLKGDS